MLRPAVCRLRGRAGAEAPAAPAPAVNAAASIACLEPVELGQLIVQAERQRKSLFRKSAGQRIPQQRHLEQSRIVAQPHGAGEENAARNRQQQRAQAHAEYQRRVPVAQEPTAASRRREII